MGWNGFDKSLRHVADATNRLKDRLFTPMATTTETDAGRARSTSRMFMARLVTLFQLGAHQRQSDRQHQHISRKHQGMRKSISDHMLQTVRQQQLAKDKVRRHLELMPDTFHIFTARIVLVAIDIAKTHACGFCQRSRRNAPSIPIV